MGYLISTNVRRYQTHPVKSRMAVCAPPFSRCNQLYSVTACYFEKSSVSIYQLKL